MEFKILFGAALFLAGWLWCYLFIRQLMFNFMTALPLIKKMRSLKDELIAIGAQRYTVTSVAICTVIAGVLLFVVLHFCPLYQIICFALGAVIAFVMLIPRMKPSFPATFDSFCNAYYRFVPDDELRTAMYNRKSGQMKSRLKAMGVSGSFIPDFKGGK